jgi:NADPH:quinone reductase-like Zn-dependent oxidoreductase
VVRIGYLQEWAVIADERVIRAPKHLSAVENAALTTAGVTAWSAIREGLDMVLTGEMREWRDGKRLEGKTILTQGTGGVSCFAIQVRRPYSCCLLSCTTLLT